MNILLDHFRENETDTTCFFTLADGEETFKWHCDLQKVGMTEAEIQTELESRINALRCGIYRKQYMEAVIDEYRSEEGTELEAWKEWVASGHSNTVMIKDVNGEDRPWGTVIFEKKWKDTW